MLLFNDVTQNSNNQEIIPFSEMINMVFTLMVITIFIGGLITVTNFYTQPIIIKQKMQKELELQTTAGQLELVRKVVPFAQSAQKLGVYKSNGKNAEYYAVKTNEQISGFAVISYGKGYSSLIKILIAVDLNCGITGITVLDVAETPGLGDQVKDIDFCKQFVGKDLRQMKVTTTDEKNCIQAVTGATISSKGVTEDAVRNALIFIQNFILKK